MVSYIWIRIIQILFLKTLKTLEIAKFRLTEKFSQALLLDYMKQNFNVKYRLKRDSMDFSSIYVTFLSMYVSTSTKGCRKCFDKIFLFTISAWSYTFLLQRNWKKETNNKGLQKYKVSEKRGFFLVSYIYLIVSYLHIHVPTVIPSFSYQNLKLYNYLFTLWRFANTICLLYQHKHIFFVHCCLTLELEKKILSCHACSPL